MSLEENSRKIKKKKRPKNKKLPKNVFEIVGEKGQTIERVDSNKTEKKIDKIKNIIQEKQKFSERTTKRRVYSFIHFILSIKFFFFYLFKKREWDAMNYEPFDITRARDSERSLQRLATRGIVQLFNTVRKQQQNSSSLSTKKNKKENPINKGEFLDMLKTIDSDEVSCKIMKKNPTTVKNKFLF